MHPVPIVPSSAAQPVERNPAAIYLATLAPSGRRAMRQALDVIASMLSGGRCDALSLDWSCVRYQHVAAVRARLAERYSAATANRMLCALRRVMQEAWRLGLLDAESVQRVRDVAGVRGRGLPAGRALSPGELEALFRACAADQGPAGARDAAMLAILYGCGLRRSEVSTLELSDVDLATGTIRIRHGKGAKGRLAFLAEGARRYVSDWLRVRGEWQGPIFCPIRKGGRIARRGMRPQSIWYALLRRAKASGVPPFSPHDLRRTFITELLERGADLALVQRLAGHESMSTTARYDRRPAEATRRAAETLHVPYIGRQR